jgi:NAD(P)-dependent dehydrogenase (short-subunit alcohol dehydrogenase family)
MAEQLLTPHATLLCVSRTRHAGLAQRAAQVGTELIQWALDLTDSGVAAQQLAQWLPTRSHTPWASATLINNAGALATLVPLRQARAEDLSQALRLGLEAPMLLCSVFLNATRDWPVPRKVLNISSGLGRRPMASSAAYCAAKAGMDHFTRCMALDEAGVTNGAKVCSLAPGVIDTAMQVQLRHANATEFPDLATFASLHEHGQLCSPEAAAARVLNYLAQADFGSNPVGDVRD